MVVYMSEQNPDWSDTMGGHAVNFIIHTATLMKYQTIECNLNTVYTIPQSVHCTAEVEVTWWSLVTVWSNKQLSWRMSATFIHTNDLTFICFDWSITKKYLTT